MKTDLKDERLKNSFIRSSLTNVLLYQMTIQPANSFDYAQLHLLLFNIRFFASIQNLLIFCNWQKYYALVLVGIIMTFTAVGHNFVQKKDN